MHLSLKKKWLLSTPCYVDNNFTSFRTFVLSLLQIEYHNRTERHIHWTPPPFTLIIRYKPAIHWPTVSANHTPRHKMNQPQTVPPIFIQMSSPLRVIVVICSQQVGGCLSKLAWGDWGALCCCYCYRVWVRIVRICTVQSLSSYK